MDILAESRLTFRQSLTVQPFAMVSGKQMCRYQDVSKESQTSPLESVGSLRLKTSVPSSVSSRFRPKGQQCRPNLGFATGSYCVNTINLHQKNLSIYGSGQAFGPDLYLYQVISRPDSSYEYRPGRGPHWKARDLLLIIISAQFPILIGRAANGMPFSLEGMPSTGLGGPRRSLHRAGGAVVGAACR